jgi:CIC family chloride channel protein
MASTMPHDLPKRLRHLLLLTLLINLIGLGVAAAIGLYAAEIEAVTGLRRQLAAHLPRLFVLPLLGLLGGGLAGVLISFVEPAARGSGIVPVLLRLRGLPVPMGWRVAAVKLLASGITIGSGFPVGPEGPSIQIGASLSNEAAGLAGLEDRQRRAAVAIGGGAGLAAVFHAPLGGIAYTLEELLRRSDPRMNAVAALACFAAVTWTRLLAFAGGGPAWLKNLEPLIGDPSRITEFRLLDLPLLLLLGGIVGLLAVPYQRGIQLVRLRFLAWRRPDWQLLPLLGLAIGLCGAALPVAFDDPDTLGFEALLGLDTPQMAMLVLVVQSMGTAVAVAAETPGGILAPALVVGASLAALVGQLDLALFHYSPPSLLFAGGAAFLAALTRTPLTAILLSFELSKDYALLLPIGFTVLCAIAVADLLERDTLFELMRRDAEREMGAP